MKAKRKIISGLIFILAGQLIAFFIWYFFKENDFIPLFISSIIGFLVSYKDSKKK